MQSLRTIVCTLGLAAMAGLVIGGTGLLAQIGPASNAAPNPYLNPDLRMHMEVNAAPAPYHVDESWRLQLPEGRKLGAPIGVEIDHGDGKTLWLYDRCGAESCAGSPLAPVFKVDASGQAVANFGAGTVNWPHGFYVDHDGNVWVTDGKAGNGKGHTVIKFAPDGKVLMTLGKPGEAGNTPDMFDTPSDVITARNGDIFVADGHGVMNGRATNDRIVKLAKDGKFITAWGRHGSEPGEFDVPHSLALDSAGRLYVGDRSNSRVQVFEADGTLVAEWRQFGRPSGVFIDKNDMIYVADSQSDAKTNPGFQQGIRIGSVKDGKVTAFIPLTDAVVGSAEELTADDQGNIYAGFTAAGKMAVRKFVKN